ncbi:Agamous-like MADS-box protein AGL86 [Linum perenne]
MVRTKLQHELIIDEGARKKTFNKRKNGLLKKLEEITTLCGVAACAFISHNFGGNDKEEQLLVWPSEAKATDVLRRRNEMPQRMQEKYMLNHETLSTESLEKTKKKLKNQQEKNQLMEIELLLKESLLTSSGEDMDYGAKGELNSKRRIVKDFIKKVNEQIEYLESENKNKQ